MKAQPTARRWRRVALAIAVCVPLLQGCVESLVIGGVAASVIVAADRRAPEVMFGDQRIEIVASNRIGDVVAGQGHVNVTSYNYMVLLTGEVPSTQVKNESERVAAEVPQVRTVINELQIAGTSSLASRSNDGYITSKVKSNFIGAEKFRPTSVKVVTEAGVVYLLGLVSREEADAATEVARGTAGVQKVVRVFEYVTPVPAPQLPAATPRK